VNARSVTNAINPINAGVGNPQSILLTIDVEDWFQVENLKECIPFASWDSCELRVERNTHRLLDLFDEIGGLRHGTQRIGEKGSEKGVPTNAQGARTTSEIVNLSPVDSGFAPCGIHATFFILGWIAKRLPRLVREIQSRGHEIASHGFKHNLCSECSLDDLKEDLQNSKKLLEDIAGNPICGYRAPSFSIHEEMVGIIRDCGYSYDSSYNSYRLNGRYGAIDLRGRPRKGIAYEIAPSFYEIPVSNLTVSKWVLPWGGGGYFRLIPLPFFRAGMRRILEKSAVFVFYMHPWEIDPDQPKSRPPSRMAKFKHYHNLAGTEQKLARLLRHFSSSSYLTCTQYLQKMHA